MLLLLNARLARAPRLFCTGGNSTGNAKKGLAHAAVQAYISVLPRRSLAAPPNGSDEINRSGGPLGCSFDKLYDCEEGMCRRRFGLCIFWKTRVGLSLAVAALAVAAWWKICLRPVDAGILVRMVLAVRAGAQFESLILAQNERWRRA